MFSEFIPWVWNQGVESHQRTEDLCAGETPAAAPAFTPGFNTQGRIEEHTVNTKRQNIQNCNIFGAHRRERWVAGWWFPQVWRNLILCGVEWNCTINSQYENKHFIRIYITTTICCHLYIFSVYRSSVRLVFLFYFRKIMLKTHSQP